MMKFFALCALGLTACGTQALDTSHVKSGNHFLRCVFEDSSRPGLVVIYGNRAEYRNSIEGNVSLVAESSGSDASLAGYKAKLNGQEIRVHARFAWNGRVHPEHHYNALVYRDANGRYFFQTKLEGYADSYEAMVCESLSSN